MRTTIYYFSGSGNSLFIAKEVQKRLPNSHLVPMVSLLGQDRIVAESDTVGLVFPVHCTTLPVPVREFLTKLDVEAPAYLFAVATQGGAPPRLVEFHLAEILEEKGKQLDAFFAIKMAWASPVGLMPVYIPGLIEYPKPPEKVAKLEAAAQKKLDLIQSVVAGRERLPPDDFPRGLNLSWKRFVCKLMGSATADLADNQIDFYADEDCTGCGVCDEVCPSQRIEMVDGQPVWQADVQCYFCYACFSFCPASAVLVRDIYAKKGERYFHPEITSFEIALQKESGC